MSQKIDVPVGFAFGSIWDFVHSNVLCVQFAATVAVVACVWLAPVVVFVELEDRGCQTAADPMYRMVEYPELHSYYYQDICVAMVMYSNCEDYLIPSVVEILGSRCRDSEIEDHELEVVDPDPGLLGAAILAILQDGVQRCCLDAVAS